MKHDWEYKRLGDVCKVNFGKRIVAKDTLPGSFPVYGGGGATFTTQDYNRENCMIVSRFAMSSNCVRFVKGKFFLNDSGLTVESITNYLKQGFIDKYLWCNQPLIFNLGRGLAQKNLNVKSFLEIMFPVPPREEQERIVAELDKINEVIEDCRELLRNLDALAQSLFYDYFGDIYHNPKKWVSTTLGDVAEKISNGANTKIELDTYKDKGIAFFRCQNVWRNRLDMSDIVFVDEETNAKMKSSILKHNDLLVTKIGRLFTENSSLGRVALYDGEDGAANLSGNLSFIRLKPIVAPKFILYILISDYFRDYVRNTTSGGIDKRALNNSQLKALPIYLPPLELQEKFAERIEQIEAQKKTVEETIANLQTLLDSRMDYWFN